MVAEAAEATSWPRRALVVVAMLAVLVGTHTDPNKVAGPVDISNLKDYGPAPALDANGWINSPPLTPADLKGKVVLYDIWTYSCINCQRTFPYVRSWFDRYTANGLVIVGIHSPEFDFEKVHKNVEAAVKRDDVTWPVALDDDMTIWNAFKNNVWPADYVADRNGNIRYKSVGEGDYTNTENVIRKLLGVAASTPRAQVAVTKADSTSKQNSNPETYLGLQYQDPTQPLIEIQAGSHDYPVPAVGSVAAPRTRSGRHDLPPGGRARRRTGRAVDRRRRGRHLGCDRGVDPARRARQGGEPRDVDEDRQADRRRRRARRPARYPRPTAARACTSTATAAPS